MKSFLITALKGFGMGAANVVPGVSGGTIALLTGIYNRIVDSLSSFTDKATWKALFRGKLREFWKLIDGSFLLALAIGVLLSILTLAKVMTWSLENYPILTWAFFFGLIVASVYYMATGIKGWKPSDIAFEIVGIALGVIVCTLTPTTTPDSYLFLFLCGAIAICTMILPGISGSFVLVIMGKYEYIMNAIDTLNLPVLAVFGLGCIVGILAFAKLLHFLMARWEKQTLILLLGFVVGSLVRVWPWSDSQAITDAQLLRTGSAATLDLQIPGAIIFCVAGIALVIVIELLAKRIKQ